MRSAELMFVQSALSFKLEKVERFLDELWAPVCAALCTISSLISVIESGRVHNRVDTRGHCAKTKTGKHVEVVRCQTPLR